MSWFSDNIWNILSLTGWTATGSIAFFFGRYRALKHLKLDVQNLVSRAEQTIGGMEQIVESAKNSTLVAQKAADDFQALSKMVVKFPDANRFRCINGVYFYIGVDGLHPKDSPLCPECLIKKQIPIEIQHTFENRRNFSCTCGFTVPFARVISACEEALK